MKTHILKTVRPYFEEVYSGRKTFEVRKNDRDFESGDHVILNEYFADTDSYSGRHVAFEIGYILTEYPFVHEDFVVFSLLKIPKTMNDSDD